MLKGFIKRRAHILYIQIWEDRIKAVNINNGNVFDEKPLVAILNSDGKKSITAIGNQAFQAKTSNTEIINPFSHPRVLVVDFTVAEKLLQHIVKLLKPKILSPIVIIQPMEKIEGGQTMVEERVLRELAAGAGASDVIPLDHSRRLELDEVRQLIEEQELKVIPEKASKTLFYVLLMIAFFCIVYFDLAP